MSSKWGCWDGISEVVDSIATSMDEAIEKYANDYCLRVLETQTASEDVHAVVAEGTPVLAENHAPDFEDLLEHIENSASDNCGLDDELIVMTKQERERAATAWHDLVKQFVQTYLKQREWSVFDRHEKAVKIHIKNGKYTGYTEVTN